MLITGIIQTVVGMLFLALGYGYAIRAFHDSGGGLLARLTWSAKTVAPVWLTQEFFWWYVGAFEAGNWDHAALAGFNMLVFPAAGLLLGTLRETATER